MQDEDREGQDDRSGAAGSAAGSDGAAADPTGSVTADPAESGGLHPLTPVLVGAIIVLLALGATVLALSPGTTTGSSHRAATTLKRPTGGSPQSGHVTPPARTHAASSGASGRGSSGTHGGPSPGSGGPSGKPSGAQSPPTANANASANTMSPSRMEAWVYAVNPTNRQLANDLGALGSVVQVLSTTTTTTTTATTTTTTTTTDPNATTTTVPAPTTDPSENAPPDVPDDVPYEFTLSGACTILQQDLATAGTAPAAPLAVIHQDWLGLLAGFSQVEQACSQAVAGTDPGFTAAWPSISANVTALAAKLVSDLHVAGYCFPGDGCPPPFTVP